MASVLLVGLYGAARRTARSALVAAGYTVSQAAIRNFLRKIPNRPVEVVVLNVSSLRQGVHLFGVAELRARHPELPIVAVCGGRSARQILDLAARAGATVTLPKPFTGDRIVEAVASCLARQG